MRRDGGSHKELAVSPLIVRPRSMHSHRISALLVCLLAAAISSSAQEKSDATTIRTLELKWTESYKQHNIDILSSLLAEDFVITIEDGSIFRNADTSVTVRPSTKGRVAELSDLKVRMHGDTAVVTGCAINLELLASGSA